MIYVFNPSPVVLQLTINHVPLDQLAVASNTPPYAPESIPVPYGPTGNYPPPRSYPETQPHLVPGLNVLFTQYSSLDPDQPTLGMEFTFSFSLTTPVNEDLILYCFRNSLWILDQFGTSLALVPCEPASKISTQPQS